MDTGPIGGNLITKWLERKGRKAPKVSGSKKEGGDQAHDSQHYHDKKTADATQVTISPEAREKAEQADGDNKTDPQAEETENHQPHRFPHF